MIDKILSTIQQKLETLPELQYISEEWGQLDYYDQHPVQFPCALIECESVDYKNTNGGQQAEAQITISVSDKHEIQSSYLAPDSEKAFEIFSLLHTINETLAGLQIENSRQLIRVRMLRVRRDDAIREFRLSYEIRF